MVIMGHGGVDHALIIRLLASSLLLKPMEQLTTRVRGGILGLQTLTHDYHSEENHEKHLLVPTSTQDSHRQELMDSYPTAHNH